MSCLATLSIGFQNSGRESGKMARKEQLVHATDGHADMELLFVNSMQIHLKIMIHLARGSVDKLD